MTLARGQLGLQLSAWQSPRATNTQEAAHHLEEALSPLPPSPELSHRASQPHHPATAAPRSPGASRVPQP